MDVVALYSGEDISLLSVSPSLPKKLPRCKKAMAGTIINADHFIDSIYITKVGYRVTTTHKGKRNSTGESTTWTSCVKSLSQLRFALDTLVVIGVVVKQLEL